ncbi:MAG: hypothetical protein ILO53_02970 [Clostridia bacterium]|nr:hypothetical protein [Clostridia bacterium]
MSRLLKYPGIGNGGSFSVEAAIVVPIVILFIALLLYVNVRFYANAVRYTEIGHGEGADCAEVHRAVSSVFDAGGDIFEMLFGDE